MSMMMCNASLRAKDFNEKSVECSLEKFACAIAALNVAMKSRGCAKSEEILSHMKRVKSFFFDKFVPTTLKSASYRKEISVFRDQSLFIE